MTSAVFDIQGHRGCRGLRPENTWPAFRHALELGVEVLELDVCLSADGQVVVSHEPWMNPEICLPPPIETHAMVSEKALEAPAEARDLEHPFHFGWMTYADIAAWDCGVLPHPRFPEQAPQKAHKPLLQDILQKAEALADSLHQPVAYNIELKARPEWDQPLEGQAVQAAPSRVLPVVLEVFRQSGALDRISLQSFDYRVLRLAKELSPDLPLVQLVEDNPDAVSEIERLGFEPAVYSPYFKLLNAETVSRLQARGIRVIPWTVNDTADMRRVRALGVDGLITDYPDRAFALWAKP